MILNLKELQLTMDQLMKANAEDDKVDEDKDGVADIDQIEKRQLAARKMALSCALLIQAECLRLFQACGLDTWGYCAPLSMSLRRQWLSRIP